MSIAAAEITPGDTAKPYDPPPEPARPKGPTGFALGDRVSFDDGKGNTIIGMVATRSGHGYWLELADGEVIGFGDART